MKISNATLRLWKSITRLELGVLQGKSMALLFVFFQAIVFFPALRHPGPWSDDWGYIYFVDDSNRNLAHDAIAAGRPILGLLSQLAYEKDFVTRNPLLLQLISMVALLILQLLIHSKLKKKEFPYPMPFLAPLLLVLMPGIQGYVYFLSCFTYSWACLLGFLSYDFVNNRSPLQKFVGFLLFVTAFLIYPAGAMFYFLSYLIDFIKRFEQGATFISNVRHLICASVKVLLGSVISITVGIAFRASEDIKQSSRIELIDSFEGLINKVEWVLTRLFVSEFRIFTVASPTPIRAAIEAGLVISMFFWFVLKPFSGFRWDKSLNFLMLLFLPLLGAIPNLLILENQFEFRTLTSTYAMSLLLWTYCFQELAKGHSRSNPSSKLIPPKRVHISASFFLVVLIPFAVFHTKQDSIDLWVKPSLTRDYLTESELRKIEVENFNPICMVIPASVYQPLNRLGVYSMKSDLVSSWVPEPYMRLKLEQANLNSGREISLVRVVSECDALSTVINYRTLESRD